MFAFKKFFTYLLGERVIVYIDHSVLRYLMVKKDATKVDQIGIIAKRLSF